MTDRLAELLHEVKVVEHRDRLASLLGQHLQVRLRQIAAHEPQSRAEGFAEQLESASQALFGVLTADPQQASAAFVELLYQRSPV